MRKTLSQLLKIKYSSYEDGGLGDVNIATQVAYFTLHMHTILYSSKAIQEFSEKDIELLARQAAYRNTSHQITGYLIYYHNHFLQFLEGSEEDLEIIFNSIRNDPRHKILTVDRGYNDEGRQHPKWRMKYVKSLEHRSITNKAKETIQTSWRSLFPTTSIPSI